MTDIEFNVESACRLCLQGEGKVALFESINPLRVTAENIYECVSVKISDKDVLPKSVCEDCVSSVESWCFFKKKCDKTQHFLQEWLDSQGKENVCIESTSNLDDERADWAEGNNEPTSTNCIADSSQAFDSPPDNKENNGNKAEETFFNKFDNYNSCDSKIVPGKSSTNEESLLNPVEDIFDNIHPTLKASDNLSTEEEKLADIIGDDSQLSRSNDSFEDEIEDAFSSFKTVESSCQPNESFDFKTFEGAVNSKPQIKKQEETVKASSNTATESFNMPLDSSPDSAVVHPSKSEICCIDIDDSDSADSFKSKTEQENSNQLKVPPKTTDEPNESLSKNKDLIEGQEKADDGSKDGHVEFTTAVTIDVNPFQDGSDSQGSIINTNMSCENSSDSQLSCESKQDFISREKQLRKDLPQITITAISSQNVDKNVDRPDVVSSTVSVVEQRAHNEEEISSSVEKRSGEELLHRNETSNPYSSSENLMNEEMSESDTDYFTPETIVQVKEEPIDSTTSDVSPSEIQLRVKSEFSSSHFEEDLHGGQFSAGGPRPNMFAVNPDDPNNTHCFICDRKYSSVGNFRAHLQTKLHMFNSGQSIEEPHIPSEDGYSNLGLESPLLRTRLSNPALPFMDLPVSISAIPPPSKKRKVINHCEICNVSFSFAGEMKRHFLSKKHKFNEKLIRMGRNPANAQGPSKLFPPKPILPIVRNPLPDPMFMRMRPEPYSIDMRHHSLMNEQRPSPSKGILPDFYPDMHIDGMGPQNIHGAGSSIFICPIQYCNFSCQNGDALLNHMRFHGIGEPSHKPQPANPMLDLRQQELFRREAEMKQRRDAEMRQKGIMNIREVEMKQRELMKREADLRHREMLKRQAELQQRELAKREAEMKKEMQQRELEMQHENERREAELRQFCERQQFIDNQQVHFLLQQPEPQPPKEFRCKGCSKVFIRESGLKKHSWYCMHLDDSIHKKDSEQVENISLEETEETVSHCPLCDIKFTSKKVFINHVKIYHKGSVLENSISPKPAVSIIRKSAVEKPVVKQPVVKQPVVKQAIVKQAVVNKQVKVNPVKIPPLLPMPNKMRVTNKTHGFICDICGKKFNLLSSFNFHMKTHTVSVRHVCRICKEPFTNRRAFMEHCRAHFTKPGSKETLCHKCFKVFKTRSELYYHRKNDLCSIKMKIYSCNVCEHSFKDPSALEEHKLSAHGEASDLNDSKVNSSPQQSHTPSFRNELNLPLKNPIVVAEKLPAKYIEELNKLSVEHNNPKLSSVSNNNPSGIKKPFQCEICNNGFSSKQSLRKHNFVFHVLNKPYSGPSGGVKTPLVNKSNQMNKQWKCRHCKHAFLTRKVLIAHLKRCNYSSVEDEKGICLQCGNPTKSGKIKICLLCLPSGSESPPDELIKTPPKTVKIIQNDELQQAISLPSDSEEILSKATMSNTPKPNTIGQKKTSSIDDIQLIKCPLGEKYFRTEISMIKHYSQCSGLCENRCTRCRRLFLSVDDYKRHLKTSTCFNRSRAIKNYPTFASKKKKVRRTVKPIGIPEKQGDESSEISLDTTYSEERFKNETESNSSLPLSNDAVEKSLKMGRVCLLCNKVIVTHRGIYRHVYTCAKTFFQTQESIACPKCNRTFSKMYSTKDNTALIKDHILECHFIPYYIGEGLTEDGQELGVKPECFCYICSFGFSSKERMMAHVKVHRTNKDEINNIVLQLEDLLFSDDRLNDEKNMFNFYLKEVKTDGTIPSYDGRYLSLNPPEQKKSRKQSRFYECDKCGRRFTNYNKFLRHKRVHVIVSKSVLNAPSENVLDEIRDQSGNNELSGLQSDLTPGIVTLDNLEKTSPDISMELPSDPTEALPPDTEDELPSDATDALPSDITEDLPSEATDVLPSDITEGPSSDTVEELPSEIISLTSDSEAPVNESGHINSPLPLSTIVDLASDSVVDSTDSVINLPTDETFDSLSDMNVDLLSDL